MDKSCLSRMAFDSHSASRVSPASVEGRGRFFSRMDITGTDSPLRHGVGDRWHVSVPLTAAAPAPIAVSFENGAVTAAAEFTWEPTDVLNDPATAIRAGDALLLSAMPGDAAAGTFALSINGTLIAEDATAPVPYTFTQPGMFAVDAVYTGTNSTAAGRLLVNVIEGAFSTNVPSAWLGKTRTVDEPAIPYHGVTLESGPATFTGGRLCR